MDKELLINLEIIARQLCKMNGNEYNNVRSWIESKHRKEEK